MAMDARRLYVLGLGLSALAMSIVFGWIFAAIHTINLELVILATLLLLAFWGINTYYVLKLILVEEESRGEDLGRG